MDEPADKRIGNAKGYNQVQEEYAFPDENVFPDGGSYHSEEESAVGGGA